MVYRRYGNRTRKNIRRKPKRTFKRRPYTRKTYRRKTALSIGMPMRKVVKMRYVQSIVLDPSSTSGDYRTFWANGIFDPDYTGTGHQPFGHDQWALLFNHYVVIGSKITCIITPSATGTTMPVVATLALTDDNTYSVTNATLMCEQNRTRYKLIQPSSNKPVYMSKTFSPKKFYNITDVKDNLQRIGATFGGSPVDGAFFAVIISPTDPNVTDNPPSFNVWVTIDYIVSLSEPKELAQS